MGLPWYGIINRREAAIRPTGRISNHIEAAILAIVRNWRSASCDTVGTSP